MIYKFTEVLNDLIDYFILGDILLLESLETVQSSFGQFSNGVYNKRKRRSCRA